MWCEAGIDQGRIQKKSEKINGIVLFFLQKLEGITNYL